MRWKTITLVALLGGAALCNAASAEWVHTASEDDPFAGGAQQFAGGQSDRGEMVMFRCTSRDDLALLFISIEKPSEDIASQLDEMSTVGKPKLLVIIDNDPVVTLPAIVSMTPDRERYRYEAEGGELLTLAQRAAAAKRRVAVAVEFFGQRIYSTAVNVRGSRRAMDKLLKGCAIDAD